jgi:hypothetical protein
VLCFEERRGRWPSNLRHRVSTDRIDGIQSLWNCLWERCYFLSSTASCSDCFPSRSVSCLAPFVACPQQLVLIRCYVLARVLLAVSALTRVLLAYCTCALLSAVEYRVSTMPYHIVCSQIHSIPFTQNEHEDNQSLFHHLFVGGSDLK